MTIGVYPGSFDPFTLGHKDILSRSLKILDKVIIAIGVNHEKDSMFSVKERIDIITNEINDINNKSNVEIKSFKGLIVDFTSEMKATVLIKGVRGPVDYDYELQMAGMNSVMNPNIETIFLISKPEYSFISSSLVKQIAHMGGNISKFVSPGIEESIKEKI
tara:strand:- start:245 stop:727 length:483 start_codon:yes stop_codon:yes gene_type:complete